MKTTRAVSIKASARGTHLHPHRHEQAAQAGVTSALSDHAAKAAPLPAVLEELSNVLSSAEANQSALMARLHRVMGPDDDGQAASAISPPTTLEPTLVVVVENLTNRVRDLIDSQLSVLARLHV